MRGFISVDSTSRLSSIFLSITDFRAEGDLTAYESATAPRELLPQVIGKFCFSDKYALTLMDNFSH
jgi:hypothetical protein